MKLKNQIALVTGATSGLGKGIAKSLAHEGAIVGINHIPGLEKEAQTVVEEIKSTGGEAISLMADVSNEEQVKNMFRQIIDTYGTLHILINNAGIQKDAPFKDMTLAQWQRVIDVNLTGQFLCAREAVNEFLRRGMQPEISKALGKIICISSVHEVIPWAGHINYASSKGGIMLFMKSLAQELAPHKIRVNSIGPGAIRTPINREAWETPEAFEKLLKLIPSGRIGEVEDIGEGAVWLASDASDYVNGITLFIDGGMTLYPGFTTNG